MNCFSCQYAEVNNTTISIKFRGRFLKPGKRYCCYSKIKEVTRKSLGSYLYPVWCPLNTFKGTCLYCGTQIREEEGETCSACQKKEF